MERKAAKKVEDFQKVGATVRWAGVENSYFAAIFIPSKPSDAYLNQVGGDDKVIHNLTFTLAPQQAGPQEVSIFVGPKDYLLLKEMGMDLEHAVDFGFYLAPIVKALFFGLRKLHTYTNNYGWAIVILTVLIKLIFTPFMQKSFASQKKMQAMQPEMKQIQDKYAKMKNDDTTNSEMPTMPPATSVTIIAILLNVCIALLSDSTLNVSGSSGLRCRSRRKKNFDSPTPSSRTSADFALGKRPYPGLPLELRRRFKRNYYFESLLPAAADAEVCSLFNYPDNPEISESDSNRFADAVGVEPSLSRSSGSIRHTVRPASISDNSRPITIGSVLNLDATPALRHKRLRFARTSRRI